MKNMFFIILLLTFSTTSQAKNAISECKHLVGTCEFYTCVEDTLKYGHKAYPISYGYHYCRKFDLASTRFSKAGKLWVKKVKTCLQETLLDEKRKFKGFKDFKNQAFESHQNCYSDSGFCSISIRDKAVLSFVIRKELRNPIVREEGIRLRRQCRQSTNSTHE